MQNSPTHSPKEVLKLTADRDLSNAKLIEAGAEYEFSTTGEILLKVPAKVQKRIEKIGRVAHVRISQQSLGAIEEDFQNWYRVRFGETDIKNLHESQVREIMDYAQRFGAVDMDKITRRFPQLRNTSGNSVQAMLDFSSVKDLSARIVSCIGKGLEFRKEQAQEEMKTGKYLFDKSLD